jgi:hypothetical protein
LDKWTFAVGAKNPQSLTVPLAGSAPPTPTGFAEIVSDDFPLLYGWLILPFLLYTRQ